MLFFSILDFTQSAMLNEHRAHVHKGETPFMCSHCGKQFATMSKLREHVRWITIKEKQISDEKRKTDLKRNFLCSNCGKCFFTKHSLQEHMKIHTGLKHL